jgi:predicted nucleotidyltransferase
MYINEASRWRQAIAREVAPIYAINPNVAATIIGGSVARGHADEYSDIELGVFWHKPPTDTDRERASEQIYHHLHGDLVCLYPYEAREAVWCDDYMIGRAAPDQSKSGVLVEVVHYTVKFIDHTLDSVLYQFNADENAHNLLAGIADGIPLNGVDFVTRWKKRAANYPDELAIAVVKRHATIDHFWRWQMLLKRSENLLLLYQSFNQIEQQLLHVLLGLNRVYYFGFKWLDVVVARLRIAPPQLARRLKQVYQLSPSDGAQRLAALVEETYDLVEQHLPTIDVDHLRHVFRYQRPVWRERPPY